MSNPAFSPVFQLFDNIKGQQTLGQWSSGYIKIRKDLPKNEKSQETYGFFIFKTQNISPISGFDNSNFITSQF